MSFSIHHGALHQKEANEYPKSISYQQHLVLHVAANCKLRWCSKGWWADGDVFADDVVAIHSPATIKWLLKKGLLEGNARGKAFALGGRDGKSTIEPPIPMLWTSAKGRKLLEKITNETGVVFDQENYKLVEPETEQAVVGNFAGEREAALAYDRVAILFYGDDAKTNFPPEESEHVVLPDDIMRQINALKAGRPPH
jgi:hypothetical protein